jgi:glycosyltransferase involved in cell wall biosynthesis
MGRPLVSVVTPTWQRNDLLLKRCIPSVRAQTYPAVEHVIVSDGPDPGLAAEFADCGRYPQVRFSELAEHDPASHYGYRALTAGLAAAQGDFIGYIDDDDAWRPQHLSRLVDLLVDSDAPWAYARCMVHVGAGEVRIGDGPLAHGRIAGGMVVHRREILDTATWADHADEPGAPDWNLIRRWLAAGLQPVSLDEVTCDYYPGSSFDAGTKIPVALRPQP